MSNLLVPRQPGFQPVTKGPITINRSLPIWTPLVYEKEKAKKNPEENEPLFPKETENRVGLTAVIGQPNLGTSWQVQSLSIFYETLEYGYSTIAGEWDEPPLEIYFMFSVYSGAAEIFREVTPKLQAKPNKEKTITSLVGLQNLPNMLDIPGGQVLSVEIAQYEQPEGGADGHVYSQLRGGKITGIYNLIEYR